FFSSRRRHTRWPRDWSSDVCSSDLASSLGGVVLDQSELSVAHLEDTDAGIVGDQKAFAVGMHDRHAGIGQLDCLNHLQVVRGQEIGRASCRKECRSWWWPYH